MVWEFLIYLKAQVEYMVDGDGYMAGNKRKNLDPKDIAVTVQPKVKFEVYGEEMIEKEVKSSGNSGRIYLPPNWIGHTVKIIKID